VTPLSRRDVAFIALCIVLAALSIFIIVRHYHAAFPEASIDFKYDRNTSGEIAVRLVATQRFDVRDTKHASRFDSDDTAQIFLERSLGLERANRVMRDQVRIWYWHHRWFRPLVEEEVSVDVAPTGEIVGFTHRIPEERALPDRGARPPVEFLRQIGAHPETLQLISTSERRLPKRVQRIYTWDSKSIRPAGAPYRHIVTVDGDLVTGYSQRLKVPDAWLRSYRELRSKNVAAGSVDLIFNAITIIAALAIFIARMRRGDLHLRFLLAVGGACILLVGGVALNSMPAQFAYYDTTTSYSAFLAQLGVGAVVECLGTAMLLIIICGAGEVLYRERFPRQLAMPRLWSRRSLGSRRVFLSLILGYALVPLFIAYQVVFYLTARKFGAWSPAEVPYDEMLNSWFPWVTVLFAGFFPALSEEFLSRAFSIPFFERVFRSRLAAIVLAGFIWGFGHSTYPNQPFYIRGLEVGIVGVVAGLLMFRFGLLPLLIWHYTVDAVYTATLLFASGNTYYIASAAAASLIFAVPLVAAVVLYVRNRGFVPDDDLSNATLPVSPPPDPPATAAVAAELPPAMRVTRTRALACVAALAIAIAAVALQPPAPDDAIDYRITKERAKEIARAHVGGRPSRPPVAGETPALHVIAAPVEGFRSWDAGSSREDGGAPGGFDSIAATYLVRNGVSIRQLIDIFRTRVEAATWTVRFFTPMKKEEIFVEVDPRTSRAIGYHKYQDERNGGAQLAQPAALEIARKEFARYGIDVNAFDVKEALSFQQPNRRDWLFHFEERAPIAAQAHRRVSVRVAGAEVTQFNKTIRVPESVYREASTQTLLNIAFATMKVIGVIALLGLVIGGIILAARVRGFPWRRPLRWTLIAAILPIATNLSRYELSLFAYSTSVSWETFRVRLITQFVSDVGLQLGVLFLALAGLEASLPFALSLLTREGRARFGRGAAVAAVTAISLAAIVSVALQWIEVVWPGAATISLSVPEQVSTPLPALTEAAQALFLAVAVSAAVALYAYAVRKRIALITTVALFFAMIDPSASAAQAPLMLARALALAAAAWLVARYVLAANPLAWPLTLFVAMTLQAAAMLLQNHRPDLLANGVALIAIAIAAVVWLVIPSVSEGPGPGGAAILAPPTQVPRDARDDMHA